MRPHYLSPFFSPQSIAVVGAGNHTNSAGGQVLRHLLASGYRGTLYPVHLTEPRVQGLKAYASLADLPVRVDLVMLATPAATIPALITQCGQLELRSVVILSAGFSASGPEGAQRETQLLEIAQRHHVRILGPNSIGVMRPAIGLSTPFVKAGSVALVSQSTALTSGVLDWASGNDIGFSTVVSIGNSMDIDFPEIVDFLVSDLQTQSILLFLETIRHPRNFMSALREAARVKPVIVLKTDRWGRAAPSGNVTQGVSAIAQSDAIFDAALRRAGVVRVHSMTQLFSAARACSVRYRRSGSQLAIMSNGEGPGALAADRALDHRLPLAHLSARTQELLAAHLAPGCSPHNPVNLGNDALAVHYRDAAALLLEDPAVEGLLVMHCPQMQSEPFETARQVAELAQQTKKPLMACWMGDRNVLQGRAVLSAAQVPNFRTPESAVDAYHYLVLYNRNQQMLFQTPPPSALDQAPSLPVAKALVTEALQAQALLLGHRDVEKLLAAFHVTYRAGLPPPLQVGKTHEHHLLSVGLVRDRMLGPALYLGPGGLAAQLPHALAYALPPLNHFLVQELVERSAIATLLSGPTPHPVDLAPLAALLLRLSELACEMPEVASLSLEIWIAASDPLLITQAHAQLTDAPLPKTRYGHMAVHPYPAELVRTIRLLDGSLVTLRPIRPEDAEMEQAFVQSLSEDTRYYRFMDALRELPRAMLVRFTQLDYAREMAIIAVTEQEGRETEIGVARYATNPDGISCEFALVVGDAWQKRGLGRQLMTTLMQIASERGLVSMEGEILADNSAMLHLMTSLGFVVAISREDAGLRTVTKALASAAAPSGSQGATPRED